MKQVVLFFLLSSLCSANELRLEPTSTLPPDGVAVVCPIESSSQGSDEVSGSGWRQLSHTQLLFGTVTLTCDDEQLCCTDLDLHGHQQWCIGGVANQPLIDYVTGRIKLPVANKSYTVTYRFASLPGRLVRIWGRDEPVTPSMCSGSVHWAATMARWLNHPVHFEGETVSHVLEFPSGSRVSGKLHYDARAAIERMRIDVGNYIPKNGWATKLDGALVRGGLGATVTSNATEITFTDFEIYADRLDDAYWDEVLNTPTKWNKADVQNAFQNSPYGCGLFFTPQSGRVVTGLKINVTERLHVHDMPGSCILSSVDVFWDADTIEIGSSFHGRPYYELRGVIGLLSLYGHSRTSMARIPSGTTISTLRYRSNGQTNPASAAENQIAVMGISDARGEEEVHVPNIDVDLTGSVYKFGASIGMSGVFRGRVKGGGLVFNASAKGAIKTSLDLDLEGEPPPLCYPKFGNNVIKAQANFAWLDATFFLRGVNPNNRPDSPSMIGVQRNDSHPEGHTQNLLLRYRGSRWYSGQRKDAITCLGLTHLHDLSTTSVADCVPTNIVIDGGRFNNRTTQIISPNVGYTVQTWPTNTSDYPVRVMVRNAVLNVWKPAPQDNTYPQQFEILTLENCETFEGLKIDQSKILDGTFTGWAK